MPRFFSELKLVKHPVGIRPTKAVISFLLFFQTQEHIFSAKKNENNLTGLSCKSRPRNLLRAWKCEQDVVHYRIEVLLPFCSCRLCHLSTSLAWRAAQLPDRTLHSYWASHLIDRRILWSLNILINAFWHSTFVKCYVSLELDIQHSDMCALIIMSHVPDRPFHNFRRSTNFIWLRNVNRWILKHQDCERVGRTVSTIGAGKKKHCEPA